jgi:amino acid permease
MPAMIINLLLFLAIVFAPMFLGAVLWACGNPKSRLRYISQFRLSTFLLAIIPLGILFAIFRSVMAMDEGARNIFLFFLSRLAPLLLLSLWLAYHVFEECWNSRRKADKTPEHPSFEFLQAKSPQPASEAAQSAGANAILADEDVTKEFKRTFGAKVRDRLSKMWCATSEFFLIQKRY